MAQEEHVSPDGALKLVVARDDDGDITLGFDGYPWHTHGDLLAASYPLADISGLTPESATARFVQDVTGNRAVIAVQRVGADVRDVWVSADPAQDLRYRESDESLQFRYWDGTDVRPPAS